MADGRLVLAALAARGVEAVPVGLVAAPQQMLPTETTADQTKAGAAAKALSVQQACQLMVEMEALRRHLLFLAPQGTTQAAAVVVAQQGERQEATPVMVGQTPLDQTV